MPDLVGFLAGVTVALGLVYAARAFLGFRAQRPAHYENTTPVFNPVAHLGQRLGCDGVIYGPFGRVQSRFTAVMEGSFRGKTGRFHEMFTYADGDTQEREWAIMLGDGDQLTAEADDIIGQGHGEISGSALVLHYKLRLPEGVGGHVLDVSDWMYLLDNGTMINRSEMRKFGFKVAELVATLRPLPAETTAIDVKTEDAAA